MGAWPAPRKRAGSVGASQLRGGVAGPVGDRPRVGVAVPVGVWPATWGCGRARGGMAGPVGA